MATRRAQRGWLLSACEYYLKIGPTIITAVRPAPGGPVLDHVFYTYQAAGDLIGRSAGAVRVVVHRYPERFGPRYVQRDRLRREVRLLSASDVCVLRQMYPIYVKDEVRVT
jgi:hypothetical protein